jgi:hypothetical protein
MAKPLIPPISSAMRRNPGLTSVVHMLADTLIADLDEGSKSQAV